MFKYLIVAFIFLFDLTNADVRKGGAIEDIASLKEMVNSTRLNTILNSEYGLNIYLQSKNVKWATRSIFGRNVRFADVQWIERPGEEDSPTLDITLYFSLIQCHVVADACQDFLKDRVGVATLIIQAIKEICKDIMGDEITNKRLRINCKFCGRNYYTTDNVDLIENNKLLIWANNELKYFPLFFDQRIGN